MKVLLTRKLAPYVDGIDISNHEVGEVLELPTEEADLLVAEEWAIPERRHGHGAPPPGPPGAERRTSPPGAERRRHEAESVRTS